MNGTAVRDPAPAAAVPDSAPAALGHASFTLTTRVTCPSPERVPNTASTAPTPLAVQNGRLPSTPSSTPTALLRAHTWVSRLCLPASSLLAGSGRVSTMDSGPRLLAPVAVGS